VLRCGLLAVVLGAAACGGSTTYTSATTTTVSEFQAPAVTGHVTQGPPCPVSGGDYGGGYGGGDQGSCDDKPLAAAVIVARTEAGREVARAMSGADGFYGIHLAAGHYTLEPQPVPGVLGQAEPVDIDLGAGNMKTVDFVYDTGIRN
jgi:hypothetical protein